MSRPARDEWTWGVGVDMSTRNCGLVVATRRNLAERPIRVKAAVTITNSHRDAGKRIYELTEHAQRWLMHEVSGNDVNVMVALEEPIHYPGHRADTQTAIARAVGALEYVLRCWGWRIELVKPGAGKAMLGGSVRAGKDAVLWSARMMTDGQITDEHQADALGALLSVALREVEVC